MRTIQFVFLLFLVCKLSIARLGIAKPAATFFDALAANSPLPTNYVASVANRVAARVSVPMVPVQTIITTTLTAYWPAFTNATGNEKGFFQASTDMVNWTMVYTFPYPTNGAWVTMTNVATITTALFYRVGSQQ